MSGGVDAVLAYLDSVPGGVDAYPECQTKGAAVRAYLDTLPALSLPSALPRPVTDLLERPPSPSGWVSEVRWHAMMLYLGTDEVLGEQGYLDSVYAANVALLDSLAYRMLFRVVSTRAVLAQAASRWSLFHRGSALVPVGRIGRREGVLRLTTPPNSCPRLIARGYAQAFRGAVVASGGRDAAIEVVPEGPTLIEFRVRWQ